MIALYPRVSTQEQAKEGYSIQEQTERLKKYCDAMGWNDYKVYTDAGYSGASMDRPALQEMIRDIKTGRISKVIVYKLDRLSRSQKDTLYLIEDVFLAHGVDFVSVSEQLDTSSPFGKAMIGILAVFAQLEREQIKERMSMGKEARAKEGKFGGGSQVPIGYDYIDGRIATNQYEKMQVIELFNLYAQGLSPYAIAKRFDAQGYRTKYGSWNEVSVRNLIRKKTYLGYLLYHGQWYKGDHEAFVSEDLFDAVQRMADKRHTDHAENKRTGKVTSYLGGLLYCSQCGAKYSKAILGRKGTKDWRKPYYVCYSRQNKKWSLCKDPNCQNKKWRMEDLDAIVLGEIRKLSTDPEYFETVKDDSIEDKTKTIEAEISKIEDQISKLIDLYSLDKMPVDILQERINDFNKRSQSLKETLAGIDETNTRRLSQDASLRLVRSFDDILSRQDFDEIRTVITSLIDRIDLDGENITIHWSFS